MIYMIIPARAGSKRLPHKNTMEFNGKPLVCWTIEAALGSRFESEVIVSTDDPEVVKICKKYEGVEIHDRPEELATDDILPDALCLYLMGRKQVELDDIIVLLQPTSPNRDSNDIDLGLHMFSKNTNKQLITINKNTYIPNGVLYITTYLNLLQEKRMYSKNLILFEMSASKSIDIDKFYQFRMAEAVARGDVINGE